MENLSLIKESVEAPFEGEISVVEPVGSNQFVYLTINNRNLTASAPPDISFKVGEKCGILFEHEKIHLFDKKTNKAIF